MKKIAKMAIFVTDSDTSAQSPHNKTTLGSDPSKGCLGGFFIEFVCSPHVCMAPEFPGFLQQSKDL